MKKAFLFLFCCTVGFVFPLVAQTGEIEARLKTKLPDTTRLRLLIQLEKACSYDDPARAIRLGLEAAELADDLEDAKQKAWAFNYIGSTYYYSGNYDSALFFHEKAFDIRKKIDDPKGLGASYNNIGQIFDDQGKSAQALDYYLKALDNFEKAGFSLGTGIANNSIGNLYIAQRNFPLALQYYFKSARLQEKLGNRLEMAHAFNNIAVAYANLKKNDSAFYFYNRSMKIGEESGNLDLVTTSLNNIGELYFTENNLVFAMHYLRRSLVMADSAGDKGKKISPLINLGSIYENRAIYDSSIYYYQSGLAIARELKLRNYEKDVLKMLARLYALKGDHRESYQLMRSYDSVKDSLFNEESNRLLNEMQVKYDTDQVKKDNALKSAKLEQEKTVRWFIIGIGIIVLIFGLQAFFSYRSIRRVNRLLDAQRKEVLQKNNELSEKNTLIGHQKQEITDSITYARTIQYAVLPEEGEVNRLIPDSFILYRPRDIVSGDFYFVEEREGRILFAVADCTGHGVPGAFMSMIGMQQLREAATETSDPGAILSGINRSIRVALHQRSEETGGGQRSRDGMDIALCCFDPAKNQISYAGANRPLWILRRGEIIETKATKAAIAGFTADDQVFETHTIGLEPGDRVILSTDGFADQFGGPKGKKFMVRQLHEVLLNSAHLPPAGQGKLLEQAFLTWKGSLEQVDDVCIMGVCFG